MDACWNFRASSRSGVCATATRFAGPSRRHRQPLGQGLPRTRSFECGGMPSPTRCIAVLGARHAARLLDQVSLSPEVTPRQVPFDAWVTLFRAFRAHTNAADWSRIQGAARRLIHHQARLVKVHRTRPPPLDFARSPITPIRTPVPPRDATLPSRVAGSRRGRRFGEATDHGRHL